MSGNLTALTELYLCGNKLTGAWALASPSAPEAVAAATRRGPGRSETVAAGSCGSTHLTAFSSSAGYVPAALRGKSSLTLYLDDRNKVQAPLEGDKQALMALYNATGGPTSWKEEKKAGWLVGGDVGKWRGVTVTNGRVMRLELDGFGLTGSIPVAIGNLTGLTSLDLCSNQLTGAWALASPSPPRAMSPPPPRSRPL